MVLNLQAIFVKEFDVQEKFKPEILRFWSRYGLLSGSKVVLHQEPAHNMMRIRISASFF